MLPHPSAGFAHLAGRMRSALQPGTRVLAIHADNMLLDATFAEGAIERHRAQELPDLELLRHSDDLSGSVRIMIRTMLEIGTPEIGQVARAAGLSPRTFQRRLSSEGTSFSALLDGVRRDAALDWMRLDDGHLAELSAALDYAHPSALSRAMQRWLGAGSRPAP